MLPHPPVASGSRSSVNSSTSHLRPPSPSYHHDSEDDSFDPSSIDPALRLRTVRTAHSAIAESIRTEALAERRKRRRRLFSGMKRKASTISTNGFRDSARKRSSAVGLVGEMASVYGGTPNRGRIPPAPPEKLPPQEKTDLAQRRAIHVNMPLPHQLVHLSGDPVIRYVRNKVRTSKYTIITFLPKNLFEQFRRVANIYFLALVVLQVFEIFGATNAQIGMLPLLAILGMTAIKDGVEDWRRAKLDDEVNNSATTKLGGWRNVNQPRDSRLFLERLFNLGPEPGRPSKGVKKLRKIDAEAGREVVMEQRKHIDEEDEEQLDESVTANKESFPLDTMSRVSPPRDSVDPTSRGIRRMTSTPSMMSRRSAGVLDWNQPGSGTAQWERTLWKKLEVGDLVLLRDNEQVPADIIVLSTSDTDALCFVETKNLDGETNLKVRRALKATSSISSEEDLEHARFVVDSEAPHANLYTYNGVLQYTPADREAKGDETRQEAITINELLLRGCTVRNTKWIIGMVVFTGADTKIMLNGGDTPWVQVEEKQDRKGDNNVVMNFVILIVLCLTTALLHGWYRSLSGTSADYYEVDSEASSNIYVDSVIIFASCLIVFQNIVPISLYITIEIVKTIQAYFIFQDAEMYYEPYDTPCVPKTWNISDDLGQIEYVFSDKTGTLTQNIMEFKKCSIRGVTFGEGLTEAMMGAAKRDGQDVSADMDDQEVKLAELKEQMLRAMTSTINNRYLREDKMTLIAPELPPRLANKNDPLHPHVIEFFRALAICHSVLSDAPDAKKPCVLDYKAESPDEAALVAAARDAGFPFVSRNTSRIEIEVLGRAETWTPLRMLEFNSSRKRMSVIVRDPDNRIVLFCKGADSVIYERLAKDHDEELKRVTLKDLETFANGGLRTLCVAHRYLSEEEFRDWAKRYDAACSAISDREVEIEASCEEIEHSLTILGATALEDKLQEGVPDAIATLHKAGIKLWILTGDKLQTAIEIGYSCNLLTNDMEVMIISADSEEGARAQIEAGLNKMASVLGPPPTSKGRSQQVNTTTFAVVIDGDSLRHTLQPGLKGLFLSLGTQCAAVICCRVSPSQKALTVRLVKEGCNAMTLAVGDGANDVAMIQEANVGIGLYGLEGSQAAMSADYAFGQFRFLTRLLLVHGRWSYVRIADMHANFFYKNIIWTLSMFWFLIFNSFDGTYLFEYTFLLLYNLVFTSLPVGILGAFDQDANAIACLAFPQLYTRGIRGLDYTRKRFWLYMLDGLYQSAIIFFVPFLVYGQGTPWSASGRDTDGLYDFGTTIAVAGIVSANLYVGVNTRYWTYITAIVIGISTLLIYLWIPVYSALAALPFNGEVFVIYPTFFFWATTLLTVFLAIGPRFLISTVRQSYFPRDKDIIREAWVGGDLKAQLGVRRRPDGASRSLPDPPSFSTKHLSPDERGAYQPAAMVSPQKEYAVSPFASQPGSPRHAFSYPPPSPNSLPPSSPTPGSQATIPPPLLIYHSADPTRLSPHTSTLVAPTSQLSYTSPTTLEAFDLATAEIKRLYRTSAEIKQVSLANTSPEHRRASMVSSSRFSSRGSLGRRPSLSPEKLQSTGCLGVSRADGGLSPIRPSYDTEREEVFVPRSGSTDFTESGQWEEQASRRGSVVGTGPGYAV